MSSNNKDRDFKKPLSKNNDSHLFSFFNQDCKYNILSLRFNKSICVYTKCFRNQKNVGF